MNLLDKKAWLLYNGMVLNYGFNHKLDMYQVAWKPHDGFIFFAYADTLKEAYGEVYDDVKNNLFKCINDDRQR